MAHQDPILYNFLLSTLKLPSLPDTALFNIISFSRPSLSDLMKYHIKSQANSKKTLNFLREINKSWEEQVLKEGGLNFYPYLQQCINKRQLSDIYMDLNSCMCCWKHYKLKYYPHINYQYRTKCVPIYSGEGDWDNVQSTDNRYKRNGTFCSCPCRHFKNTLNMLYFS